MKPETEDAIIDIASILKGLIIGFFIIATGLLGITIYEQTQPSYPTQESIQKVEIINPYFDKLFNEDNNYYFKINNNQLNEDISSQLVFDCDETYLSGNEFSKLYVAFNRDKSWYSYTLDDLCRLATGNVNINVTQTIPDKGIILKYNRSAFNVK